MSARTTDFDQLVSADPADRVAAFVTGPGEHWEPERPKNWPATSYDAPPRTIRWTGPAPDDLTGSRYGRLRVVGLIKATGHWSNWLVRCQCGAYEDRSARAIKGRAGPTCWRCDRLVRMQRGSPLEPAPPQPKRKHRPPPPRSTTEVILAARSVRRAAGMEPRTAMHAALAAALQGRKSP